MSLIPGFSAVRTVTLESPLTAIDIMCDGATLAVGSTRGKVYIYDLRQAMEPVRTFTAHKSSIHCLKFQSNCQTKVGGLKTYNYFSLIVFHESS